MITLSLQISGMAAVQTALRPCDHAHGGRPRTPEEFIDQAEQTIADVVSRANP